MRPIPDTKVSTPLVDVLFRYTVSVIGTLLPFIVLCPVTTVDRCTGISLQWIDIKRSALALFAIAIRS
ncbi:hypothetical protein D3C86_1843880 [compost metagenome]